MLRILPDRRDDQKISEREKEFVVKVGLARPAKSLDP